VPFLHIRTQVLQSTEIGIVNVAIAFKPGAIMVAEVSSK
jgi:hypothetical protein